jgi:hypothetical protein
MLVSRLDDLFRKLLDLFVLLREPDVAVYVKPRDVIWKKKKSIFILITNIKISLLSLFLNT